MTPDTSNGLGFMMSWRLEDKNQLISELDGVGPVDTRPSTDWLQTLKRKEKIYMTRDMWHVTHGGRVNILSKFHLLSSFVEDRQCLTGSEQKDVLINEWINLLQRCL